MKKRLFFSLSLLCFMWYSCNNKEGKESSNSRKEKQGLNFNDKNELQKSIASLEDSLMREIPKDRKTEARINLRRIDLMNRMEAFVQKFPQDVYAGDCWFKLHLMASAMKAHRKSVAYGDSLLINFPNHPKRILMLESMASAYDIFLSPRDEVKIKFYLSQLIKEKGYPEEQKKEAEKRMKYIHLSFDEYVQLQAKSTR